MIHIAFLVIDSKTDCHLNLSYSELKFSNLMSYSNAISPQYIITWEYELGTLPGLTATEIKFIQQQYRNGAHLYYMYLHYRECEYLNGSEIAPKLLLHHKFKHNLSKITSINLYGRYFLHLELEDLKSLHSKINGNNGMNIFCFIYVDIVYYLLYINLFNFCMFSIDFTNILYIIFLYILC